MALLKVLAVLSALGFIACVVATGAGGSLSSTKFGSLKASEDALAGEPLAGKANREPAKDAGGPPPPVYFNSTKAGPLPLPREEPQPKQSPQPPPQQQAPRQAP